MPQEGVWARLDPLNDRRYAPVPDVSNTAGAASMLIGWGDPVCIRRTKLYWDIMRAY
jgi:hypothetical protein